MALAHGGTKMTLPHVIQEFKTNLGFLPALWADDGDFVLVDDVLFALKSLSQLHKPHADVLFVTADDLRQIDVTGVEPWGWDKVLCRSLSDSGVSATLFPSDGQLELIRRLSERRQTSTALSFVRNGIENLTCGESAFCQNFSDVSDALRRFNKIVVKAPWSSSGRGVRYIECGFSVPLEGWVVNTIAAQGGVMVEPYYKKVKDFALEFSIDEEGVARYCGLSVFETNRSSYSGNIIATEESKMSMLCKYLSREIIEDVKCRYEKYFSTGDFRQYKGLLGVDMMVVGTDDASGFVLHPCVEINVRRTMGHVANSLNTSDAEPKQLMRIVHDVNYKLKFDNLENCFVKVY